MIQPFQLDLLLYKFQVAVLLRRRKMKEMVMEVCLSFFKPVFIETTSV